MLKDELEKALDKLDLSEPKDWGTEYGFFSMRISKETEQALKELGDSQKIQERILKRYITSKFDAASIEVENMKELKVLYEANLLQVKDGLGNLSKTYEEYLDNLTDQVIEKYIAIKDKLLNPLKAQVSEFFEDMKKVEKELDRIKEKVDTVVSRTKDIPNSYVLTEIIRLSGEWDRLSETSKQLVAPLFARQIDTKEQKQNS